jgi:hypothetical protein
LVLLQGAHCSIAFEVYFEQQTNNKQQKKKEKTQGRQPIY